MILCRYHILILEYLNLATIRVTFKHNIMDHINIHATILT